MKCPYRNFEECLEGECPSYFTESQYSAYGVRYKDKCTLVEKGVPIPNGTQREVGGRQ